MYDEGTGVKADPVEACKWLALSANQAEVGSQKYLIDILDNGRVTRQQLVEGARLAAQFVAKP